MTENELLMIKNHIEIHARREPNAVKITEVLHKAVDELENLENAKNECFRAGFDEGYNAGLIAGIYGGC